MEIVLAALIWSADRIDYVPMTYRQCAMVRSANFHSTKPLIECLSTKWTCEHGFRFAREPLTN